MFNVQQDAQWASSCLLGSSSSAISMSRGLNATLKNLSYSHSIALKCVSVIFMLLTMNCDTVASRWPLRPLCVSYAHLWPLGTLWAHQEVNSYPATQAEALPELKENVR